MASSSPLLSGTIEADDETPSVRPQGSIGTARPKSEPVVLVPGTQADGNVRSAEEGGIVSYLTTSFIFRLLSRSLPATI